MAWLAAQAKGRGAPAAAPSDSVAQRINMYLEPPPGEVTIEDFEGLAVDRLRGAHASPVQHLFMSDTAQQLLR